MPNGHRGQGQGYRHGRGDEPRPPQRTYSALDISGIVLRPGENGALKADLFDTVAQTSAKMIAGDGRSQANKQAQLRQFYDELVMWEEKARQYRQQPDRFAEYLPFIRMVNAKAAYAQGRGHVDANFVTLIGHCIGQVDSYETLRNFKLFFEAFLGFYKLVGPKG